MFTNGDHFSTNSQFRLKLVVKRIVLSGNLLDFGCTMLSTILQCFKERTNKDLDNLILITFEKAYFLLLPNMPNIVQTNIKVVFRTGASGGGCVPVQLVQSVKNGAGTIFTK